MPKHQLDSAPLGIGQQHLTDKTWLCPAAMLSTPQIARMRKWRYRPQPAPPLGQRGCPLPSYETDLLLPMLLRMRLRRVITMLRSMGGVASGRVRMVCRFLVASGLVMSRCLAMMAGGMRMVFRGLFVVVGGFLRHVGSPWLY